MTPDERTRAARAFIAAPLSAALFEALRREYLDAIASTPLPDRDRREIYYLGVQAIEEMKGTLENWAREAK